MKKIKYLIHGTALATCLLFGMAQISHAADEAKVVEIHANDNMKFDLTEIDATPGQTIKLTLKNIGTMPKASMGHNFVLLTSGTDLTKFTMAAMTKAKTDYVPEDMASSVIAHTKLLGPGEEDTIEFKAPAEAGDFTFICSFPGHAAAGMKGVLKVK